ncbi:hypothetical protein [Ponticaulis profundi]|uniref:Uncharacterized protein n=1 Tax=Ponticaulis profundi TaxID=2665222 RepID=A0ABW1SE92_9PROT
MVRIEMKWSLLNCGRLFPAAIMSLSFGVPPASSQSEVIAIDNFEEHLSDFVPMSGHLFVGLGLVMASEMSGSFQISDLQLRSAASGQPSCLLLTSRDGRYVASGSVPSSATHYAPVKPPSERGWSYQEPLKEYDRDDIAGMVFDAESCSLASAKTAIPIKLSTEPDTLIVQVNSQRATNVQSKAVRPDSSTVDGECSKKSEGSSRAFDTVCRFDLGKVGVGNLEVFIRRVPRSGPPRVDQIGVSVGG